MGDSLPGLILDHARSQISQLLIKFSRIMEKPALYIRFLDIGRKLKAGQTHHFVAHDMV